MFSGCPSLALVDIRGLLCLRGRLLLWLRSRQRRVGGPALPHSIALALGRDHRGVLSEAVEQGGGEFLVTAEDLGPFTERQICCDDNAPPATVACGEHVEQQLAALTI